MYRGLLQRNPLPMPRAQVKKFPFRDTENLLFQEFADLKRAARFYSADYIINDGQTAISLQNDLAKAAIAYARRLAKKK